MIKPEIDGNESVLVEPKHFHRPTELEIQVVYSKWWLSGGNITFTHLCGIAGLIVVTESMLSALM
jgi:hypothetical protein